MPHADKNVGRAYNTNYKRQWRKRNLEKYRRDARIRATKIREANYDEYNRKQRAWRKTWDAKMRLKDKERQRRGQLLRQYGISVEDFEQLLENQNGLCAICRTDNWGAHGPVVDHNHATDKVRGILCNKCNLGIGHLNDSISSLERAIEYLKER